ncbi:MAG: 30S ribosomal protein S10 [Candidatus Nanoarchaeia archaeon]|jgi:small subunit ribosomal protein S10|nr:30S ribosomal protein S10 [Candidatus Nanoarchaeia archaeon]|tara:strand:- start:10 stop:318 length:309 start_codon:yes stop_codon:yes gene_type:complete
MPTARIKLYGTDLNKLNEVIDQIKDIATKTKTKFAGPIMIPTKTLKVPVRKSPQGEGKASWENYELRIHKRMIDLAADERALHLVLRVPIPSDINLEIQLLE